MITVETIESNPAVAEALAEFCDMEFAGPTEYDDWFTLQPGTPFRIFAHDSSGGLFAECGAHDPKPIVYASSEGEAGSIGRDLQETVQIVAALPCWRDYLHFSGGGQLAEMYRAAPLLEEMIHEDYPNIDNIREMIFSTLDLDRLADPIASLHQAVSSLPDTYLGVDEEGNRYGSLFNTFVVNDNPKWKDR